MRTIWRVLALATLAVAAWSAQAGAQIPNLNHYLCHKTRDLHVPAKFTSVPGISANDEVGNFTCEAKKPFFLCNPVVKNGSPIVDANAHYCCYKVKCNPNKIPASFDVTDQFGALRLQTSKAFLLCNPCETTAAP